MLRVCQLAVRRMGSSSSSIPSAASLDLIQSLTRENCVVVFSKTTCGFCARVKEQFNSRGIEHHVLELNQRGDGPQIQAALGQLTGATTVPRVFVNGKFVGGCSETTTLLQAGEFAKLLEGCKSAPCAKL